MLKKVLCLMLAGISLAHGSVHDLTSPQDQLVRLSALIPTRGPDAPFPELLPQFEENSQAILSSLKPAYHTSFEDVYTFTKTVMQAPSGLTLYRYNMAHYLYALVLEASQQGTELDAIRLNTFKRCFETFQSEDSVLSGFNPAHVVSTSPEYHQETFESYNLTSAMHFLVNNVHEAHKKGLCPLSVVTQTGILPLETLNKSFAIKAPMCGLPLTLSGFDGSLDSDSFDFLQHDWNHVYFQQGHTSPRVIPSYTAFKSVFDLMEKTDGPAVRIQDQICLFFMGHEKGMFMNEFYNPEGVFDFKKACCALHTALHQYVEVSQEPFSKRSNLFFRMPERIQAEASIVSIIESHSLDTSAPFDWESIDLKTIPELGDAMTPFLLANLGFLTYNELFDIQAMLAEAGISFPIWKDGVFNRSEMMQILTAMAEDFQKRYEGHFPIIEEGKADIPAHQLSVNN